MLTSLESHCLLLDFLLHTGYHLVIEQVSCVLLLLSLLEIVLVHKLPLTGSFYRLENLNCRDSSGAEDSFESGRRLSDMFKVMQTVRHSSMTGVQEWVFCTVWNGVFPWETLPLSMDYHSVNMWREFSGHLRFSLKCCGHVLHFVFAVA